MKGVYHELTKLDDIGFKTWNSSVRELASRYNLSLDYDQHIEIFKRECQEKLECRFVAKWLYDINDEVHNPIVRTYKLFKTTYDFESYLDLVENPKYRIAISRLKTCLQMLEIERERHTRPITPLHKRLCPSCNEIEDERHFVFDCPIYRDEGIKLYEKIHTVNPSYVEMMPNHKYIYSFTSNHRQIFNWFGKFICVCFEKRSKSDQSQIWRHVN